MTSLFERAVLYLDWVRSETARKVMNMSEARKQLDQNAVVAKKNSILPKLAPLSLTELRLLAFCLAHYDSRKSDNRKFTAKVKDLISIFPGMDEKSAYAVVQKAVIAINHKPLRDERIRPDGRTELVTYFWFSGFTYLQDAGEFTFVLSDLIEPYLLDLKGEFTRYRLRDVYQFSSALTWKVYEFLKQWEGAGKWAVGLEDLRELLGISGKYPRWEDFKSWVLEKPIQAINKQSDLMVTYEKTKTVRTVTGVVFFIQTKDEARRREDPSVVATIGDLNNDVRRLMSQGVAQPQAERLSHLAREAGRDLGVYLDQAAGRYEALPKEKRFAPKGAYIYRALYNEFSPNLFDNAASAPPPRPMKPPAAVAAAEAWAMGATPADDDPTWTGIKERLAGQMPEGDFRTWIKPLRFRREGEGAVLGCPNSFYLRHVTMHFESQLKEAFQDTGLTFTLENCGSPGLPTAELSE